jgi:RecJ-like exonuclease
LTLALVGVIKHCLESKENQMETCPACQGRGETVNNTDCPWCAKSGKVTKEVAIAHWNVRKATRFRFHAVFGARVPIDDKNEFDIEAELARLKFVEPVRNIKLDNCPSSDTHCLKCGNLKGV